MKKNPFAYLKRAPKLKGYVILTPAETILHGDLFTFVDVLQSVAQPSTENGSLGPVPDSPAAHMHVGGTLLDARKSFGAGFDGIVYRKLSKK